MYSFTRYLQEEAKTLEGLDLEFIKRAEHVTSFNISTKDLQTTKYKDEIQHLFNKHFFPSFDISETLDTVSKDGLNALISKLKAINMKGFKSLHNYNLKGVGPGEVTLYFLLNNAQLGGGSSAGLDLIVGSEEYEVKAVSISRENEAYDFKVGGTIALGSIITRLTELRDKMGIEGNRTEISPNNIKLMRSKNPLQFGLIEKEYQNLTYNEYFSKHDIIFINNKTAKIGNIESIKRIKASDISIYHVTSGTIKPKVKL